MKVLGLIPDRIIPETGQQPKGLWTIGEETLLERLLYVAMDSTMLEQTVVSTNSPLLDAMALQYSGIDALHRPDSLCEADSPVIDTIIHALEVFEGFDAVALLQCTSPFLKSWQVDAAVYKLRDQLELNSVQTITRIPHNQHAWNQRHYWFDLTGDVFWAFPEERKKAYNKQRKPQHWAFGNLVVTRVSALQKGEIFAEPSAGIEIDRWSALDVDTREDLELARMLVKNGMV